MLKLDFPWLYSQAKNKRTKLLIQELERKLKSFKTKSKVIIVNVNQNFPLELGKWKIWLNKENCIASLDTYLEIFKERAHSKLSNFPTKNDLVVIDLGANEGFYTLKIKEIAPKSKIIAVEPNPSAFKVLKNNIETNKLKNVIVVNKAVTSKNGKVLFEIVKGVTAIGGLKVYGKRSWLDKEKLRKIIVDSITLEDLCKKYKINKIDLLKLDIEGNELEVLKNSKNILDNTKKVVVEFHGEKMRRHVRIFMLDRKFKILLEEKSVCGDIYFMSD